jgi:hypothetical protein
VLATQLFFVFVPVNDKDKLGRKIARFSSSSFDSFHSRYRFFPSRGTGYLIWHYAICRFICRYVIGYFPVSLHVEDYNAFDPNRAFGELILTAFFPFLDCRIIVSSSFQSIPSQVERLVAFAESEWILNRKASCLCSVWL